MGWGWRMCLAKPVIPALWKRWNTHELSGGMQQCVGLARAFVRDPAVLLMDEAFSALNPLIGADMQDELLKLQQHKARTIIFISRDLQEAVRLGDRIAVMEGGQIVQIDTPDAIVKNPADVYVRSFFRGVDPMLQILLHLLPPPGDQGGHVRERLADFVDGLLCDRQPRRFDERVDGSDVVSQLAFHVVSGWACRVRHPPRSSLQGSVPRVFSRVSTRACQVS